jgi:hypothetical protein
MKKFLIAAIAFLAVGMLGPVVRAADEDMKGEHSMTGVLIDNACGNKDSNKTEADCAKHPMSCAKKDACAASGYQLVVGDKHYKLDDKGNDQAKAYLDKAESTKVTVMGTMDGDNIKVSSIKAAEDMK